MWHAFHHNLQTISRGNDTKHEMVRESYRTIPDGIRSQVVVAGFTELMSPEMHSRILHWSTGLNEGLQSVLIVDPGCSALRYQEYIGISWNPGLVPVDYAGVILPGELDRRWHVHSVPADRFGELGHVIRVPDDSPVTADVRGPAFIAAVIHNVRFIFAFMHNVYNNQDLRSVMYRAAGAMASSLRKNIGGDAEAQVIIGGDFNLPVDNPYNDEDELGTEERESTAQPSKRHKRARRNELFWRAAMEGGKTIPTTNTHSYDYFLVSDPRIPCNSVTVHTMTRRPKSGDLEACSATPDFLEGAPLPDHAAVSMDFSAVVPVGSIS